VALSSHFIILLAIALYFTALRSERPVRHATAFGALAILGFRSPLLRSTRARGRSHGVAGPTVAGPAHTRRDGRSFARDDGRPVRDRRAARLFR
jgi:hypothetical protein